MVWPPKTLGRGGGMNIASPPRFGAGTLVTPAAWLSTGLSPGDTDRAVLEGDGVSDALPAAGVLAGRPLVAGSDPVSLDCAVREIFLFLDIAFKT